MSEAMTGLLAPDFSSNKGDRAGRAWSCILWLYKSQRRETREGRNNTAITKRKHTDREQNTERTEKKEKQREDRQSKLRGRENWREKQKQRDQKKKRQKVERRPKTEASPSDKHLWILVQIACKPISRSRSLPAFFNYLLPVASMRELFTHGSKLKN
jgi:hypothetical protein